MYAYMYLQVQHRDDKTTDDMSDMLLLGWVVKNKIPVERLKYNHGQNFTYSQYFFKLSFI